MTVTAFVKARAFGAIVTTRQVTEGVEGHVAEERVVELGAWDESQFHLEDGEELRVVQGTAELAERIAAERNPPAADALTEEVQLGAATAEAVEEALAPELDQTIGDTLKVAEDNAKKGKR